jgi:hypothetical protein
LKNFFDADDEITREQLILSLAKLSQRTVKKITKKKSNIVNFSFV